VKLGSLTTKLDVLVFCELSVVEGVSMEIHKTRNPRK
jgi:hypothetical protein